VPRVGACGHDGRVPELPEVESLARFLTDRTTGRTLASVAVATVSALKTYSPAPSDLVGRQVRGVTRHGKWLDLATDGPHLVWHLSRAGWVRWYDSAPTTPVRPGRSPLALRVVLDDGAGFDLTEQGTRKRLAVHVVDDPAQVPLVASLGVEPLGEEFTPERFVALARERNQQVKGLLRDQRVIAGIGNAYSDEILHAARMSPFALTGKLTDEDLVRLHGVIREVLTEALDAFAEAARRQGRRCSSIVGEAGPVLGLWERLADSWGPPRDVRPDQPSLVMDGWSTVPPDPAVRVARPDELPLLLPASVAMFMEEVGYSPLTGSPGAYEARVRTLAEEGRTFVRVEEGPRGPEVVFKADLGAVTRQVAQVQGVWVAPRMRGRRLSEHGMAAVVAQTLGHVAPVVSLYVNSYNAPALACYRRVGFRQVGTYATVLF
jgi:DNA-formamidopyrimidine glycosylase